LKNKSCHSLIFEREFKNAVSYKYGYSTSEFYRRFQDGELGDDDDLLMWGGLYHLSMTSPA
jgi:hypothetical protein